jgi:hypothetical protein
MNDTQDRLASRGLGGFGGDDYNPFFQSWFGRPAFGPSGFGYPGQGGPFSNGAGPDIRRSPFGSIDDRPRSDDMDPWTVKAFESAPIRFFHPGTA